MPKSKTRKGVKKKDPASKSKIRKIGKGSVSYQAGGLFPIHPSIKEGDLLAFTKDIIKEINHGV
jgi:hypothetical protein